jgi:hypothetical protein
MQWSFDKLNQKSVAQFIGFTNGLIAKSQQTTHVDLALNVLKNCRYDMQNAIELLRPVAERGNRSAAIEAHFKLQGKSSILKPSGSYEETEKPVRSRQPGTNSVSSSFSEDQKSQKEKQIAAPLSREECLKKAFEINPELCYVCKDGGDIVCCDKPGCNRSYHLDCYGMLEIPKNEWYCRAHFCDVCGEKVNALSSIPSFESPKPSNLPCQFCARVFCEKHKIDMSQRTNSVSEYLCDACSKLTISDKDYFEWHLFSFHRAINPSTDASKDMTAGGHVIDLLTLYQIVDTYGEIENVICLFFFSFCLILCVDR